MSIADCPNFPKCGHIAPGQCDANVWGERLNTPTPAPDLDARVSALKVCPFCGREPKLLDLAGWEVQCTCGVNLCLEDPSQAAVVTAWNIRAELQRPALHEPVSDAEMELAELGFETTGLRATIERVLQGRAKPAQETSIGNIQIIADPSIPKGEAVFRQGGKEVGRVTNIGNAKEPAQEEITDAERLDWLERNQLSLYVCTHQERRARTDGLHSHDVICVFDGWGVGMNSEEKPTVREAIDTVIRASKGEKT